MDNTEATIDEIKFPKDDSTNFRSIESHFSFNSKFSEKEKEFGESKLKQELDEAVKILHFSLLNLIIANLIYSI